MNSPITCTAPFCAQQDTGAINDLQLRLKEHEASTLPSLAADVGDEFEGLSDFGGSSSDEGECAPGDLCFNFGNEADKAPREQYEAASLLSAVQEIKDHVANADGPRAIAVFEKVARSGVEIKGVLCIAVDVMLELMRSSHVITPEVVKAY